MMRKALAILALGFGMPLTAAAEPVPEYVLKATYLYNFALYTEWPAEVGDTLNLCILGEDRFGGALDAIHGKPVNKLTLNVSRISTASSLTQCQIVFVGESEHGQVQKILGSLDNAPVLTVTEGTVPLYSAAMISLAVEDKRLAFHVNASAARRAKLSISSKLLRLAKTVY